jgi:hypothetical protein
MMRLFRVFGTKDGWLEGLGESVMDVTAREKGTGYSNVGDPRDSLRMRVTVA